METTYENIIKDLKAGKYYPVYLLEGEETYYIDAVADYIEKNVLDDMAREFDQTILYGKDLQSIDVVINAAKRFPMMGTHSVIIVREAQNIKSWANLVYYLEKPQPTTILVFCYKNGTLRADTEAFKKIKEHGIVLKSEPLKERQIPQWIENYVAQRNLKIDNKAVQILAAYLGTDLSKIINELDKLILGRPDGVNTITAELVERNVGISKDYNIFELQDAIVHYDILKANRIVYYFADNQKKHPIQNVLAYLFGFFSKLMIYHYLPDRSQNAVAGVLGVSPYAVRNYEQAARYYSAMQTMRTISWIREADMRSKGFGDSNSSDTLHIYQELIYHIMHKAN